ncbi:MAG TPA: formylglycine-generating enzyme family protein, partial [Tepidisphaeraceae bacterium]|nr:formylglycine-generating enzyme family protein [Tepidisphaeraceae bacterium]
KFHLLNAAATRTGYVFTIEENNTVRAALFGDENKQHLTYRMDHIIPQALEDIAARTTEDNTPWAAGGWTDDQKAAGNKAYTLFIDSQSKVEKNPIEGLDVVPDLQLSSDIKAQGCKEDPMWKKFWQGQFQQFGWARSEEHPSVTLFHGFACQLAQTNQFSFPDYYRLSDEVDLVEANLAFELNGRLVRKPATIFQTHRMKIAVKADLEAMFQSYVPRSILEFTANLKQGDQPLPAQAGSANPMLKDAALGMKFVRIEPGTFTMGSPDTEEGRGKNETPHRVTLTRPFYMATTDVTRGQFAAFVDEARYKTEAENASEVNTWKYNLDFEQEDTQPVVDVTWNDAVAFTEWLSRKEHKTFRLPTEAEWEYACRAGTTTPFNTGATIGSDAANFDGHEANGENRKKTTPVGSFPANQWGLYDMHGNVWQWCSDVYADYSPDAVSDPSGPAPTAESGRVLRGGSYRYAPAICRSAYRYSNPPAIRYNDVGFRVVLDAP